MKKHLCKALAMAVMMSVLASGSAYAAEEAIVIQGKIVTTEEGTNKVARIFLENDNKEEAVIWPNMIGFHSVDPDDKAEAMYSKDNIIFTGNDGEFTVFIDKTGDAEFAGDLFVKGALNVSTSGEIKSGETGLVNGGAVYTALQGKADKASSLAGYGITDAYTKDEVNTELGKKADKATTLAGYGITDGATKTELEGKADKATTLAGYGITDAYTKSETDAAIAAASYDDTAIKADIAKKADKTDLDAKADKSALETEATTRQDADDNLQSQIDTLSSSASAGMSELASKINQTDARVDRVGATAAALAGIHYQPMAKGQSQVAVGMGGYKGKKATALGLAYQFNDRVSGSVAGAANGSEHMFNVGFNYLFGQHSAKDIAQCAAVPGSMSLKEAEMQATIDSQNAKINSMESRMAQLEAMVKALAAK